MSEKLGTAWLAALAAAERELRPGFEGLPLCSSESFGSDAQAVLLEAARRLRDNYPYGHPLYAGQMLKPPHPVARAAYALAMALNPNNHALDGGRASARMETEAVSVLASLFGWSEHLGHLTSGGTFANLEALWIAGQLGPGKVVVASDQAHYTHSRICSVLKLPFRAVRSDSSGRMDLSALELELARGDVGCVVGTLGTTATGAVDAVDTILQLRCRFGFRLHVDAAYGGFFGLAQNLTAATRAAFGAMRHVDSVVIDPHKHGLQPYGCGCVLFRDPAVGRFYKHDSPYTYFTSGELHPGEVTLECSRPGAAAVALWATQRLLPYTPGGEFASALESCRKAALALRDRLCADARFVVPTAPPELDIVVWAVRGGDLSESSAGARAIFDECARRDLHLALAHLPARFFPPATWPDAAPDATVTCLRSVQMKPEHMAWGDAIWSRLRGAAEAVLLR